VESKPAPFAEKQGAKSAAPGKSTAALAEHYLLKFKHRREGLRRCAPLEDGQLLVSGGLEFAANFYR
jgi:hypothetical protein